MNRRKPSTSSQPYLDPYLRAAHKHGSGFEALLWASPRTQQARFDALIRAFDFNGRTMLDVGCGRADLLDYLLSRRIKPSHYVGIDAVEEMVAAAQRKSLPNAFLVQADIVREPHRLFTGAEIVVFCGSLNTFDRPTFFSTLRTAYEASVCGVVFNFLSSPALAAADYLHWYAEVDVLEFAHDLTDEVQLFNDYMNGDCTIRLGKQEPA